MNWYKGNIADAVAHSKTKNAIFVVYVEGKDEATAKINNFISEPRIKNQLESDDFVAIKIESETETYMQFASIYQIVPVPSIFFIGSTGTPMEIATGVLDSVEELEAKITKVLESAGKASTASSISSAFIREEAKATSSNVVTEEETKQEDKKKNTHEIVCKDAICFKKPKESLQDEENTEEIAGTSQAVVDNDEEETKLQETRKLLEQKRRERIEEEKRLEKENEIRRRKEGKHVQNLRSWQKDQELKDLKESIKRERLEDQVARDRIRAQIAADKAERAHKFAPEGQQQAGGSTTANVPPINKPAVSASDETRLQFRFASGTSNTNNFKSSTTLSDVRDYVMRELLPGTGIKDFILATTYPKRELTNEHNANTLLELELFPSAVILIIGKEATGPSAMIARNGGMINMFVTLIMSVLNPIFGLLTSAKNWVTGKRAPNGDVGNNTQTGAQKRANDEQNVQNDVSKRRNLDRFLSGNSSGKTATPVTDQDTDNTSPGTSQGGAYRRYIGGSNIHRLSDNRKDSDDENATWNGNSTQQQ